MAYIDPGAGTVLVQAAIAAVVGGIAVFRHRLRGLFNWRRRKAP